MKYVTVLMYILLFCLNVSAQTNPIDSDRPDFSESASALSQGMFQFETGFVLQNSSSEEEGFSFNLREVSLLSTLLRYGLFSGIELRAGFGYLYQRNTSAGSSDLEGINELTVGTKIQIIKDRESMLDLALLAHVSIPANENFEPAKAEPELILAADKELNDMFGLAINIGGAWASETETVHFLYAIAADAALTEQLGAFLEVYGEAADGIEFGKNIDAGFTYLLEDNFQLDISAGTSFDQPENNWFLGVGASIRLPE